MERACLDYLVSLDLPPLQLGQLMSLWDHLHMPDAKKATLLRWVNRPWCGVALRGLPALLSYLVKENDLDLCKQALHSSRRGAVCELQVG